MPDLHNETMNPSSAQRHYQVADGATKVFAAEVLILPTGLLLTIFLTRRLGPEVYGLFILGMMLAGWMEAIVTSIFARTTVRFVGRAEDWRPVGATVVRVHLVVSVGAALLLWALAPPIAAMFDEPRLVTCLRWFALDVPLFSLGRAHRSILIGLGGFRGRALMGISGAIARLLLMVVLVEMGFSLRGAIAGYIGASLVELVIGRLYVRPSLFRRSSFPIRQLWGYAAPLFLFAVTMRFHRRLDRLALKVLGAMTAQVGIYSAAKNLVRLPNILAMALSPLLLSTLSHMVRAGENDAAREMGRNAMRMVVLLLPFAALAAGAAREVIGLVFGVPFLPAAPLLVFLIFGAVASVMISVCTTILTAADKPNWPIGVAGPMLLLAAPSYWILIPRFGSAGAALVTTIVAVLGALGAMLAVYRVWRILPPAATWIRALLIGAVAYLLALVWPAPGFLVLIKLLVIAALIVGAFLAAREFSVGELAVIGSILRGRMKSGAPPSER